MTLLAIERAPAKINLCLFLGPTREDGRHQLVTVFDSVELCDELRVHRSTRDEVVCADVAGPNLVASALQALRGAGWDAPPVRVTIDKRIPVAAGMGGGSADAAALLRLAPRLAPIPSGRSLAALAAGLGADVPSQLDPGPSVGTGAGDEVRRLSALAPYAVVVVVAPFGLSTPDVYREADRLGLSRAGAELAGLAAAVAGGPPEPMVVNDLQPAAISLAPVIAEQLSRVRAAGADRAIVCGSGPTVIGLCWGRDGLARAQRTARRIDGALAVAAVGAGERRPAANE